MKTIAILLTLSASLMADPAYQLHEWGTFTTVSGSDGVLLSGLEREEEALPYYVYAHDGMENGQPFRGDFQFHARSRHGRLPTGGSKGFARPLTGVTVKMETPVIYFHSPEAFRAQVKVDFDGGTISQWYPQRSAGEVLPEPPAPLNPEENPTPDSAWLLDFSRGWKSSISWDVDVLSPEASRKQILFKPRDTLSWVRARVPDANVVRTSGGETEGFLFYRGVGNFDPGVKTTVDSAETLHLTNQTNAPIPWLVAFEVTPAGKLRWSVKPQGLDVSGSMEFPESSFTEQSADQFPEELYRAVHQGLASQGLTDSEAQAMVETWWKSYFETPGLRVFWILPQSLTERILPLQVTPKPAKTVRVLVGRSEVFRPRDEAAWKIASGDSSNAQAWSYLTQTHRFGLCINQRVTALSQSASR